MLRRCARPESGFRAEARCQFRAGWAGLHAACTRLCLKALACPSLPTYSERHSNYLQDAHGMNTSKTSYSETIQFGARYMAAWSLALVCCGLVVWAITGYNARLAQVGWAVATAGTAIVVAVLINHISLVQALAGYTDAETLANRHTRVLEFPCSAQEALDMVESVLRDLRQFASIDVESKRYRLTAHLKNFDRYSMMGFSGTKSNLVYADLEPGDGVCRATLRFEPSASAWRDWWMVDNGRNLDSAITITTLLEARIAERRRSDRQSAERAILERQLAQTQLHLLQAQVEPHFLYNTLASAQLLTRSDPARADLMLGHLIAFLRSSLPGVNAEQSTLGVEVERSQAYLDILRIRMGERLKIVVDVPDALRSVPLPSLLLQTLVENAIKHGLEPKSGGGTLWIRAEQEGDAVRISVADDGRGLQAESTGTGLGLKNVRDRLHLLYGTRASLVLATNYPAGITATMKFPLNHPQTT